MARCRSRERKRMKLATVNSVLFIFDVRPRRFSGWNAHPYLGSTYSGHLPQKI